MIKFGKNIIYLSFVVLFTSVQFTYAQNTNNFCPNFVFTRNMQKGSSGQDVLVLQKILNLDSRTQVAKSGVGSKGQETRLFGEKTRDALKRFQALFIEYTIVADGKFNSQTRLLVNDICTGPYFTGDSKDVFSVNKIDPNDKTGPTITLSGPDTIYKDETIRVNISGNENILQPDLSSLILDGAVANDIRKISPRSYSVAIKTSEDNNSGQINVQIEAGTIRDLNGNKNENASNELLIEVLEPISTSTASTSATTTLELSTTTGAITDFSILNSILDTLPSAPPQKDCVNSGSVSVYNYTNPCYGKANMVSPTAQNAEQNKKEDNTMLPFLIGLLQTYGVKNAVNLVSTGVSGLLKSLGLSEKDTKLVDSGGYGSIIGQCMCKESKFFQQKTIGLFKIGGVPYGRYIMTPNPTVAGGPFVGKIADTPIEICGQAVDEKGKCVNPEKDSAGSQNVMGIIPAPPIFSWTK